MNTNEFPLTELDNSRSANNLGLGPDSSPFNQNDKIIFDELKALVLEGDWETLLVKLLESPEFPIDFKDELGQDLNNERYGYTLLHYAASKKKVECVRVLIVEFSAEPNIKAGSGYAPIHLLVSSDCRCNPCTGKILDCLRILLDEGGSVDEEDGLGETALYGAARNRLCEVSGFLLSHGANINHWVNGHSVATLLAQYVPDVLELEFDKYIRIDEKVGVHRSLRLDFRLLLQEVAVEEGLPMNPPTSPSPEKRIFSERKPGKEAENENLSGGKVGGRRKKVNGGESVGFLNGVDVDRNPDAFSTSSTTSTSSTSSLSSPPVIPPMETELLNYLLRADFAGIDAVVNHPLVEAFVHLKWLSVRNLFFLLRSVYLFFISLYTFYVFDTFVNATCFYNSDPSTAISVSSLPAATISGEAVLPRSKNEPHNTDPAMAMEGENATFGFFLPTTKRETSGSDSGREYHSYYYWHSFSDYFKAHEMTCEPHLRTQVMAYIIAVYGANVILYELYKFFESWYDYFKSPINFCWWLLAVNIGIMVVPGMGFYAHSWHYPYAAFSLVYGWIFVLSQIIRMPYLGTLVFVFVKVLQDFILLLFTFSPVLLAFAVGFAVMLPQNEFFRFLPTAFFKVFLMMTGDVDFWGVFKGTWNSAEYQGHVYIPLFIIYSLYILTVTMVLMSLLLGLAVDNIQEVRREAALYRTVRLIEEIGIFESILHKPAVYYCGFSKYFRRLFSITSLRRMNGPELIIFPEDPEDDTLPKEIMKKMVPYLISSCCCGESSDYHLHDEGDDHDHDDDQSHEKTMGTGTKGRKIRRLNTMQNRLRNVKAMEGGKSGRKAFAVNPSISFDRESVQKLVGVGESPAGKDSKEALRKRFLGRPTPATQPDRSQSPSLAEEVVSGEPSSSFRGESHQLRNRELLNRDLELYKELKLLLEDNEKLKERLEMMKRKLMIRK